MYGLDRKLKGLPRYRAGHEVVKRIPVEQDRIVQLLRWYYTYGQYKL